LLFKIIIVSIAFLLIVSLFSSCGFVHQEHVVGKYYIIGVDSQNDLSLDYDLGNGSFIGRAPANITEYGYNDTFLVIKTLEYNQNLPTYYIINMTKDFKLANEEAYRIGPLSEIYYDSTWKNRLNVKMKKIK